VSPKSSILCRVGWKTFPVTGRHQWLVRWYQMTFVFVGPIQLAVPQPVLKSYLICCVLCAVQRLLRPVAGWKSLSRHDAALSDVRQQTTHHVWRLHDHIPWSLGLQVTSYCRSVYANLGQLKMCPEAPCGLRGRCWFQLYILSLTSFLLAYFFVCYLLPGYIFL